MKITIKELDYIIDQEIEALISEGIDLGNMMIQEPDGSYIKFKNTPQQKAKRREEMLKQGIERFQSLYRALNTDQRYYLVEWLKKVLLKELNLKEIEEITSRVVAASDGLRRRKDPTQKPK